MDWSVSENPYGRNGEDWRISRAGKADEARGIGQSALFNTLWLILRDAGGLVKQLL